MTLVNMQDEATVLIPALVKVVPALMHVNGPIIAVPKRSFTLASKYMV